MYKNDAVVEVQNMRLTLQGLDALGVGFEPMPGNKGAFPIVAVVNGDTSNPVIITDRSIYTNGGARIQTMEVVVYQGGGEDGDRWRVTLKQECGDSREGRLPTSESGVLLADKPQREMLFYFDTEQPAVRDLFDWIWTGEPCDYIVDPRKPTSLQGLLPNQVYTGNAAEGFIAGHNLSRFSRVTMGFEAHYAGGGQPYMYAAVRPFIRTVSPYTGKVLETFYAGTRGDIGSDEDWTHSFVSNPCMTVELGVPAGKEEGLYYQRTPRLPFVVQFGLETLDKGNGIPAPTAYPGLRLVFYAMGH